MFHVLVEAPLTGYIEFFPLNAACMNLRELQSMNLREWHSMNLGECNGITKYEFVRK